MKKNVENGKFSFSHEIIPEGIFAVPGRERKASSLLIGGVCVCCVWQGDSSRFLVNGGGGQNSD